MDMSGLEIEIADLVMRPGATMQIMSSQAIPGLRAALGGVEDHDPVDVTLSACNLVEGVEVTGEISGTLKLSCSRCLVDFEKEFASQVKETFWFEAGRASEGEGYEIQGTVIDLEPMLRDVIVLSIPVHPVHAEDCKGLCPRCGADRNVEDCGHEVKPADERWAPLEGFFDRKEGGGFGGVAAPKDTDRGAPEAANPLKKENKE